MTAGVEHIDYRAMFDLAGQTAIVTGGCGTLGREFAAGLAQCGARVALLDLDRARAEELAAGLKARYDIEALGLACDIAKPEEAARAVDDVVARLGRVDILLNNAQSATPDPAAYFAPFEHYSFDEWRRVLAVDLDGMAIMAQAVCRHMTARGHGGTLIQIGSIYGAYGPDNRIYEGAIHKGVAINNPAVYAVGKAGVIGLTRWLATSYGQKGVRANAVVPGGVESGQSADFVRRYADRVPMGRMARKEEIVGAVLWLASPASSYVTGQSIFVDGGLSAW